MHVSDNDPMKDYFGSVRDVCRLKVRGRRAGLAIDDFTTLATAMKSFDSKGNKSLAIIAPYSDRQSPNMIGGRFSIRCLPERKLEGSE